MKLLWVTVIGSWACTWGNEWSPEERRAQKPTLADSPLSLEDQHRADMVTAVEEGSGRSWVVKNRWGRQGVVLA